jgi:hypothetical protein
MYDPKQKRAAQIQSEIRHVLFYEWDPIGVSEFGPDDEYDSYIGPVYRILAGSRSEDELIELLWHTERKTIGLTSGPRERLPLIAHKLLTIDVGL